MIKINVEPKQKEMWQEQVRHTYKSCSEIAKHLDNVFVPDGATPFKVGVTPYLLSLMDKTDVNCPIRMQYLPSEKEWTPSEHTMIDELGESGDTIPGTSIVHRYPQRVLFLVGNQCASYCRFCTRKRMVGVPSEAVQKDEIEASLDYIAGNTVIQDVLLSGGDPMMLADDRLDYILSRIRKDAPHVKFVRIGSRMLVQNPYRVTDNLLSILERNDVQMVNIHINHPKEITNTLREAMRKLSRSVMIGCQTVLLKGINDDGKVLRDLFMECISMKVRPYYVYSTDMVEGAYHFVVPLKRMLELYREVRGYISGPAVPTFVVDGLNGLGKMPVIPEYVKEITNENGEVHILCTNYKQDTTYMDGLL